MAIGIKNHEDLFLMLHGITARSCFYLLRQVPEQVDCAILGRIVTLKE